MLPANNPMSEMLANQYFLARRYALACEAYEKVLKKHPRNNMVRRKLIICYTQIGEIQKALKIFKSCLDDDIDCIVKIDPIAEDCPCPELVGELETKLMKNLNSVDFHLMLGMLWLYCNIDKSLEYFKKALQLEPENVDIKNIIFKLISYQMKEQRN